MKSEELVLAKCINNIDTWADKEIDLEIGKYYVVEEINIGQSNSTIKINGKSYNSILFEYYNDYLKKFNIYNSKYSPYFKREVKYEKRINWKIT